MPEPSDANLRAILVVLLRRLGGTARIRNEDLYNAMLPGHGVRTGAFTVEQTDDGIVVTVIEERDSGP